jgi:hypothetical protein
MPIVGSLISIAIELIPIFIGLIIRALTMRREGAGMLHAASLALRIVVMLAKARKAGVCDFSQSKRPELELRGRILQLLDMSEAEIETVDLSKGEVVRLDAYKARIRKLNCNNAVINILDVSESVIDVLSLAGASINVLDAYRAEIKTLDLGNGHILNMDLTESMINNLVGVDSAKVYIRTEWHSRVGPSTNKSV